MLAAALLVAPSTAQAHSGGGPVAVLQAGPYVVQAYDQARGDTGDLQRYPVTVFDASNHKAADVTVTISARDATGTHTAGPAVATATLNGFDVQLPVSPADGWTVTIAVTGPRGAGTVSYHAHAIAQASPTSGSALFIKGVVVFFGIVILVAVLVVLNKGRRAAGGTSAGLS